MYDYDKTVMNFLWISAIHFATELRAVPARPVPVRALPAEHPLRRGGLGGTGSGGLRIKAATDRADGAAHPAAPARGPAAAGAPVVAERPLAQRGDERMLRSERGNDRRRTAAWPPGTKPSGNTPTVSASAPLVAQSAPHSVARAVARQSRQKHLRDAGWQWN